MNHKIKYRKFDKKKVIYELYHSFHYNIINSKTIHKSFNVIHFLMTLLVNQIFKYQH